MLKNDWKSMNAYLRTTKHPDQLSSFFNKTLAHEKNRRIATLLQHGARGEQKEAEAILRVNPEFISQKGLVLDYSGNVTMSPLPPIFSTAAYIR